MMIPRDRIHSAVSYLLLCLIVSTVTLAAELHVMTSGTFTASYLELKPLYERATGHSLVTKATGMGIGESLIPKRLERGERADVVIMDAAAVAQAAKDGTVIAESRVDLVRTRIGMAVRTGAPVPDISSVDALKRVLLAAKSIGFSSSVSGEYPEACFGLV